MADSPLTSIEFWKASEDSYVLKIGKEPGKKKLDKKMFNYLMSDEVNVFEKYALINALGWEINSKIHNSKLFLSYLKKNRIVHQKTIGSNKNQNFNKKLKINIEEHIDFMLYELGEEYYLIYQYLNAMDNYLDVSEIIKQLNRDLDEFNLVDESNNFIYMLIKQQYKLQQVKTCDVWEEFCSYISKDCITDDGLHRAISIVYNYIGLYSKYCNRISIYVNSLCNINNYSVNKHMAIDIINYPVFVYGTMKVFDEDDILIFEKHCDGNDLFTIEEGVLEKGSYKIYLIDDETLSENFIYLKLI